MKLTVNRIYQFSACSANEATEMKSLRFLLLFFTLSWRPSLAATNLHQSFLHCLSLHSKSSTTSISKVVYTPRSSSYQSILGSPAYNLRFTEPTTPRPLLIITPTQVFHVQAAIICSKQHSLQIRTRSGGHDSEGLSFVSHTPFILLDMTNFRSIHIDAENQVAWVQVAALLGELYYRIAEKSENLSFPAGTCHTVGVGGHFSGGGYGALLRTYGLAADNIIDAQLVDADGRVLDRKSMGEDLFWAIRGGGGASFGVITAFKVRLVRVPSRVTVCSTIKTADQNATKLVHDWQFIAPNLPKDVTSFLFMTRANPSVQANKTLQASFQFLYLGRVGELIKLMQRSYPELQLSTEDCVENSWIEYLLLANGFTSETPPEVLLNRTLGSNTNPYQSYSKAKSDYVREPVNETAIEGIWQRLSEAEGRFSRVYFVAYGGKMNEISETEIPFPHRAGNLYMIGYLMLWEEGGVAASRRHINWSRRLYRFMGPYVSKSPRQAYLNYRDLDIGANKQGNTSFAQAGVWGFKYFGNNFYRLARVKAKVDPANFFLNEQSIPVL